MPSLNKTEAWDAKKFAAFKKFFRELVIAEYGPHGILSQSVQASLYKRFEVLIKKHTDYDMKPTTIERLLGERPTEDYKERLEPKDLAAFIDTIEKERHEQNKPLLTSDEKRSFWVLAGYPASFKEAKPSHIYKHIQDINILGRVIEEVVEEAGLSYRGLRNSIHNRGGFYLGPHLLSLIHSGAYEDTVTLSTAAVIFAALKVCGKDRFLEGKDSETSENRAQLFCKCIGYPYDAIAQEAKEVEPNIDPTLAETKEPGRRTVSSISRIPPVKALHIETRTLSELARERCYALLDGIFEKDELRGLEPHDLYGLLLDAGKVDCEKLPEIKFTELLQGAHNKSMEGYDQARALGIAAGDFMRAIAN